MSSRPEHFGLAAEGFTDGERYDRARPGYPADAIAALCVACEIGPGRRVLDLAAGTGKLTRALLAAGAEVTAVEPVSGMRAQLVAALTGAAVLDGTAERIPAPDESMDAITIGQAFHWFDGPAAVDEIRRVLVPGGTVGLIWNVMNRSVPWVDRLQELIHRHRGANPWYASHAWRSAFAGAPGLSALEHAAFTNVQPVDSAGLADRVASISFIATLAPDARAALMDEARRIVDDELPGQTRVEIPYVTDLYWARRVT
jgi:SAM-dependent methyltransferase